VGKEGGGRIGRSWKILDGSSGDFSIDQLVLAREEKGERIIHEEGIDITMDTVLTVSLKEVRRTYYRGRGSGDTCFNTC